jgi:hypothetical protein
MTRVKIRDGDELKTDDTEPNLSVSLVKDNGVPQVLTGYDITFQMREANGDSLVVDDDTTGNVSITDADLGRVEYDWDSSDTSTAATYECEFTIDDSSDSVITFPNQGFFTVQIEEGL